MSRKGVIAKRVKAAPDGHIENQRRTRRPAGRGTNVPRSAKTVFRPTEVSAKVQTARPITQHDPGNIVPRSAKFQRSRHAAHDQAREPGKQASRPRNHFAYHGRCIRPSREERPTSGRETIGQIHPPTSRPTVKSSGPTVPTRPKTRLSGRPSRRPSERRGRPEAVFEAQSAQFKPKAGADLARLGLAAYLHY
ncbi:unnamed protein product [Microthlaspi erraticum]|uniref:Uncharacterized protein n=1 Tax=Microthlaspi erraticum TaxID=1685480 RepID=A0A6D2JLL1_9BRAS|nr:unnamed protein product [Microthlaspi erraticum]